MRIGSAILLLVGCLSCRSVSLASDLFHSSKGHVSTSNFWSIDWTSSLIPPRMLEYSPRETASPVFDVESNLVLVATRDGVIRALSATDGKVKWEFRAGAPFNAGGVIDNSIFYVGGADGVFYALKAATGAVVWKYDAGEEIASSPVVAHGKVLFSGSGDTLFVLEASSGQWAWQYRREMPSGFTIRGTAKPLVVENAVYTGFADGNVVSLNFTDGTMNWERSLAAPGSKFRDVDTTGLWLTEGKIVFASYSAGVHALNSQTGEILWGNQQAGLTSLTSDGSRLVGVGDNVVAAFSAENGRLLWRVSLIGVAGQTPWVDRKFIAVPSGKSLVFLAPSTGKILTRWNPGTGVSSTPIRVGSRMFVLSNVGTVLALRLEELAP